MNKRRLIEARISILKKKLDELYINLGWYNYYKGKEKNHPYYKEQLGSIKYVDFERDFIPPSKGFSSGYFEGVDNTCRTYKNLEADIKEYEKELEELESILIEKGWY